MLNRRQLLPLFPGLALTGLGTRPAAAADEFLGDARTAKGVTVTLPRTSLREALRVISEATEIPLTAVPAYADQQIIGYIPRRPVREIMGALETLFDGVWVPATGAGGYRLDLDPVKSKAAIAARDALLKKQRKEWDDASADVAKKIQNGMLVPSGRTQQIQIFANLLWNLAPPAERDKVMAGATVTFSISEAQARPVYELMIALASKPPQPLTGPLVATIDLEDRADTGFPLVRTRATARRQNSILSIITASLEFPSMQPVKKEGPPETVATEDYTYPNEVGESGRFNGTRDEILIMAARAANAPMLSRHRAYGASAGIGGGGRRLGQVVADFALISDAVASTTARGFHLARSRTEMLDSLGLVPEERLQPLLKKLPAEKQPVSLELLSELHSLTPLHLSILQRSNVGLEVISFAREAYALLRFYHALTPEQRTALFSPKGIEATALSHTQLHMMLDQRDKRGDFDVYEHLQELNGLRFRFLRDEGGDMNTLGLQLLRGDMLISSQTLDLPAVEKEPKPEARR